MTDPIRIISSPFPDKAPVRIQIWMPEWKLDYRAWVDELTLTSQIPPLDYALSRQFVGGGQDIVLRAHTGRGDSPWKFVRGKPERMP